MLEMTRPPDVNLDTDAIPDGCYLLEGKYLTETMRRHKIPFGLAKRCLPLPGGQQHRANVGLLLFESDRKTVDTAMEKRAENKIHTLKYKGRYASNRN